MKRTATVVVISTRMQVRYIAVEFDWFTEYIGTKMRDAHSCFIAEGSSDYIKISYLECELGDTSNILKDLKAF